VDSEKTKKPLIKFSKRRILSALGGLSGVGCATVAALMTRIFISLGGYEVNFAFGAYVLNHFLLSIPFALAFLFNLPMRFARERRTKKIIVKHLTFFYILVNGVLGTCSSLQQLPEVLNVFPGYFWFTYGIVTFFMAGATFLHLLIYGGVYFVFVFHSMVSFGEFTLAEKFTFVFMLFQLVHFTPVALLARSRIKAIRHAFKQLEKVFYPHQIQMIRRARELEQTMPTAVGEACVICFDIIGSSQIQHENLKKFLRNIFARCNTIMMEGYNGIDMAARGYRIKEMGDGFLCSVGYPFRSHGNSLAHDAVELALAFHAVFQDEVRQLEYDKPIHCGLGIALDAIAGFYPESGAKEYDLHGRSIVLATRYEAMRKSLFPQKQASSVLILQERVWSSLKTEERSHYIKVDLRSRGLIVRDDPDASFLCYRLLDTENQAETSDPMPQLFSI
jgi:class 3 adenylate cyclase